MFGLKAPLYYLPGKLTSVFAHLYILQCILVVFCCGKVWWSLCVHAVLRFRHILLCADSLEVWTWALVMLCDSSTHSFPLHPEPFIRSQQVNRSLTDCVSFMQYSLAARITKANVWVFKCIFICCLFLPAFAGVCMRSHMLMCRSVVYCVCVRARVGGCMCVWKKLSAKAAWGYHRSVLKCVSQLTGHWLWRGEPRERWWGRERERTDWRRNGESDRDQLHGKKCFLCQAVWYTWNLFLLLYKKISINVEKS